MHAFCARDYRAPIFVPSVFISPVNMFKNLLIYRIDTQGKKFSIKKDNLDEKLKENALRPCGSFEMESKGWLTPCAPDEYVHAIERQWLIHQGLNQKLLPASIINQVTRERADKLAEKQEHPVGRKQLRELRGRVIEELMPKALTRRRSLAGWMDTVNGWLIVDTAAPKKADEFMEALIAADVEIAPIRLDTQRSPAVAMTQWLTAGKAPADFTIDQELELRSAGENQATVRYVNHPLDGKEIRDHISAGKTATRLGLTWKNRVSFVLTDQWQVKRITFLELLKEDNEAEEIEDPQERFDAEFVLMTGELSALLADLAEALGGVKKAG